MTVRNSFALKLSGLKHSRDPHVTLRALVLETQTPQELALLQETLLASRSQPGVAPNGEVDGYARQTIALAAEKHISIKSAAVKTVPMENHNELIPAVLARAYHLNRRSTPRRNARKHLSQIEDSRL